MTDLEKVKQYVGMLIELTDAKYEANVKVAVIPLLSNIDAYIKGLMDSKEE